MGGQMPGRRILALVALLGCAATACSDADSDPPPDKPATHSSTDSPTTRSAPSDQVVNVPALPRGARKHSLAGAEAFVRHYIDLRNYASNTGKTSGLRHLSRNCDGCNKYADLYESVYANGGYIKSSGWVVQFAQAYDLGPSSTVLVTVKAPRMRFKRDADDRKHIGRGGHYKLRFELKRTQQRWVVTHLGVQANA